MHVGLIVDRKLSVGVYVSVNGRLYVYVLLMKAGIGPSRLRSSEQDKS